MPIGRASLDDEQARWEGVSLLDNHLSVGAREQAAHLLERLVIESRMGWE
jgi:hypothetical protein